MQTLADRLRNLTNAGDGDYTVGTVVYWTDEHLQDVLDRHQVWVVNHPVTFVPQTQAGGTVNYLTAITGYRDWEAAAGTAGTERFIVRETDGDFNSSANYTPDYENGRITWSATQGGTAYMVTGYSYDVYAAAVDVLRQRLAYLDYWYDFEADNQTFTRSQVVDNINGLIANFKPLIGNNVKGAKSGDLSISQMVRVDI